MTDARRDLPSVSALLERPGIQALLEQLPRTVVVHAIRAALDEARRDDPRAPRDWELAVAAQAGTATAPGLAPLINATGVVLHTNLGRAPLAEVAISAIERVARGYCALEYDVDKGVRGSRYEHCAALLRELTGADGALVVNNCASALVLAMNTVAAGRTVVLSRGELVEIGGSFRVHDIVSRSGAGIREVGATNRTHLSDYAGAMDDSTGALLKIHRSNFAQEGYVAEVDVASLAALARERGVPLVHDLGSGLLISLERAGLVGEPTAREALDAGADVVVMSGDKLLGGPQAGIIVGRQDLIEAMRANPLVRALRVDKLTLAALEATLLLYRDPERAWREIPVLRMLGESVAAVRERAARMAQQLGSANVPCDAVDSEVSVGAGAHATSRLPSAAIALHDDVQQLAERLRRGSPAVIGRVQQGTLLLDCRTIADGEMDAVVRCVISAHG